MQCWPVCMALHAIAVAAVQYTAVHCVTYAHCMKGQGKQGLDAVFTHCWGLSVCYGGRQLQCMSGLLLLSSQGAGARRVPWCLHYEHVPMAPHA